MKKINYYRGLLMAGLVVLHFGAASHVYEVTGQEFAGGAKAVAWEEMVLGDVVMFENSGDTGLTGNMQEEVTDIPVAGQEAVTDIPVAGQEVVTDMLPDMKPGEENTWNTAFTDEEENYDMTETEESVCVDFIMSVTEDVPTVKAGEAVGYEIMLENIGNVDLENLELRSILDNGKLEGEWLERQGFDVDTANGVAVLELLEAGTAQKVVLMAEIPEERQENLPAEFVAKVRNPLFGEESVSAAAEMEYLSRSQGLTTQILPLEIAFTVQKWPDRAVAVAGETITYQICIRNTGERSLHSVLTTEKFQAAGIKAHFMEAEGVILNGEKTEALVSEIKPGEAVGLFAQVSIPKDCEAGELLNEVTVVTRETGEKDYCAQAAVEIVSPVPTEAPEQTEKITWTESASEKRIREVPRTEDLSETELWAGAFGISCLIVIGIYWLEKAKRKR